MSREPASPWPVTTWEVVWKGGRLKARSTDPDARRQRIRAAVQAPGQRQRGATKITATVNSTGKTYPAKVVGYDKTGDVVLIQLQNASRLKTVPLGNSSSARAGDTVVAMGNAEGRGAITAKAGHITRMDKTITASEEGGSASSERLHGMIQTNADVVPGDSGGPLASAAGVIGIDTAGNDVSYERAPATGFAVPINTALAVARQIAAGHASSAITIG